MYSIKILENKFEGKFQKLEQNDKLMRNLE